MARSSSIRSEGRALDSFERALARGLNDYRIERRDRRWRFALRLGAVLAVLALALGVGGWHLYAAARHETALRASISACASASARTAASYDRANAAYGRGVKAVQSLDADVKDMGAVVSLVEKPVPAPKSRDCTVGTDAAKAGYERDAKSLDGFTARLDAALGPKS